MTDPAVKPLIEVMRETAATMGAMHCISTGGAMDWPLGACIAFIAACMKITDPPGGWITADHADAEQNSGMPRP